MKKQVRIEFESNGVKCYVKNDFAILKLACNAFTTLTSLDQANKILPWFDAIEQEDSINGIIGVTDRNCMGEKSFEEFLSEVAGRNISDNEDKYITRFEKLELRAIEINMLVNVIRKILGFKKLFISTINGEIVTPFFGISLAGDFRFASDDSKVLFSHVKYGIHPSGAIPFFLPKYINHQQAVEFMLKGGVLTSSEAKNLNLINEILPSENFEENCIKKAAEYAKMNQSLVRSTKGLIFRNMKTFEDYVQLEANYVFK